jgi:DNA-binding GntR family transcriptional regulator
VVEALAMTLRERVLDGQIDAGAGLTESDVAARYDVSRPTAKTAISLRVHEGLLRREAHKSAYVPAGVAHRAFVVADLRFHHALIEAVDSPRLYAGRSGEIHLSMVQATTPGAVTALSPNTAPSWTPWTLPNQTRLRRACSHPEGARDALAEQFDTITDRAAPADTRRSQPLRTPSCAAEPSPTAVVTANSPPMSAHPVSGVADRAQSLAVSCGSR